MRDVTQRSLACDGLRVGATSTTSPNLAVARRSAQALLASSDCKQDESASVSVSAVDAAPRGESAHAMISTRLRDGGKVWSGRLDSNQRPPDPQSGALTRLRYAPNSSGLSAEEAGR